MAFSLCDPHSTFHFSQFGHDLWFLVYHPVFLHESRQIPNFPSPTPTLESWALAHPLAFIEVSSETMRSNKIVECGWILASQKGGGHWCIFDGCAEVGEQVTGMQGTGLGLAVLFHKRCHQLGLGLVGGNKWSTTDNVKDSEFIWKGGISVKDGYMGRRVFAEVLGKENSKLYWQSSWNITVINETVVP